MLPMSSESCREQNYGQPEVEMMPEYIYENLISDVTMTSQVYLSRHDSYPGEYVHV